MFLIQRDFSVIARFLPDSESGFVNVIYI